MLIFVRLGLIFKTCCVQITGQRKRVIERGDVASALFLFFTYSFFPSSFFLSFFLISFSPPLRHVFACVYAKGCKLRRFRQLRPSPTGSPLRSAFCHSVAARSYRELLSFGTRSLNLVNDNRARPLIRRLVHRCLEL